MFKKVLGYVLIFLAGLFTFLAAFNLFVLCFGIYWITGNIAVSVIILMLLAIILFSLWYFGFKLIKNN